MFNSRHLELEGTGRREAIRLRGAGEVATEKPFNSTGFLGKETRRTGLENRATGSIADCDDGIVHPSSSVEGAVVNVELIGRRLLNKWLICASSEESQSEMVEEMQNSV
jgi:hypothetical protein